MIAVWKDAFYFHLLRLYLDVHTDVVSDRYVISNNTIETPSDVPGINAAILEGIIPKLPANVITIEQAIAALGRSGPAIY